MKLKTGDVEKFVSCVEGAMCNKISDLEGTVEILRDSVSTIKESIRSIKEQNKNEIDQFMKIQPCVPEQIAGFGKTD